MARADNVTPITPRQPGARKLPRAVREQQMLAVAERMFASRGFHAVSVDAIAEGAGISKPMVYAYFGSKEGLYRACMAQAEARLFSSINRGADLGAAAEQQLWLGLLAFFTFVDEHRDSWNVLFGEATAGSGPFVPEAVRVRQRIARQVSQLLRTAAAAEGVTARRLMATEPLANALIGSAESLANWWIDKGEESKETVATWLMNFAWLGFGDLVQGQAWLPEGQAGKRKRRAGTG